LPKEIRFMTLLLDGNHMGHLAYITPC